jgi:hypothetical protein
MRKIEKIEIVKKRYGTVWTFIKNYSHGKTVLHTCGPSYIHENGSKKIVVMNYDEYGNSIYCRSASRKEMLDLLLDFRKTFSKV